MDFQKNYRNSLIEKDILSNSLLNLNNEDPNTLPVKKKDVENGSNDINENYNKSSPLIRNIEDEKENKRRQKEQFKEELIELKKLKIAEVSCGFEPLWVPWWMQVSVSVNL